MSKKVDVTPIGLTKIWAEGQGVERTSARALSLHIVRRAWENLRRSPITASLTVVTIGIALFLFGSFLLVVQNADVAVTQRGEGVMVHVFVKDSPAEGNLSSLERDIQGALGEFAPSDKANASVVVRSKAEALARFREMLGDDQDLLLGIDEDNPLPASIDVVMSNHRVAEELHAFLSKRFLADARVESIRYSKDTVNNLRRVIRVVQVGGVIGVVFLLVITGFIIANTIKLALYSHRIEVEIMQLVGATRGAIFAPYILEGGVQGVFGALLSILLVLVVYLFLGESIGGSEILTFVFPSFRFLSLSSLGLLMVLGASVGMIGSFFAVRRFVAEE